MGASFRIRVAPSRAVNAGADQVEQERVPARPEHARRGDLGDDRGRQTQKPGRETPPARM